MAGWLITEPRRMNITMAMMQNALCMGFSQGAQPIISFSYGAGKPERVREAFSLLLRTCFIFSTLVWLAMMLIPRVLCAALTDNTALVSYAAWAMRIYAASMLLLGVQCACQQTFIGIGNAKTSLFLAVLRKLILLIPLIYVMLRSSCIIRLLVQMDRIMLSGGDVVQTASVYDAKTEKIMEGIGPYVQTLETAYTRALNIINEL